MGKEFEIKDFIGMMPSTRKPPLNSAMLIENFDLRKIDGDMHVRKGYDQLYAAPTGTNLSAITYWDIENFYIPDVGTGQEITVQIGKGTLTDPALTLAGFTDDIILIWTSHSWNGSAWVAGWNWLNETIGTRIYGIDPLAAGDVHIVVTDIEDTGQVAAGYFDGWYVENQTEGGTFRVVDTISWNDGSYDRVCLRLDGYPNWNPVVNARLFLQKNLIPYNALTIPADDASQPYRVSFHKVRNELRIGFGGQENKLGLAISYELSHLHIKDFAVDASFTSAKIDNYCEIDGLVITPYGLIADSVRGELEEVATGTLAADDYKMKQTGYMNSGDEFLLGNENAITITGSNTDISWKLFAKLGLMNQRLLGFGVYFGDATTLYVYYLMSKVPIRGETRQQIYSVNIEGEVELTGDTAEKHDPNTANAAAPVTVGDLLNVSGWTDDGVASLTPQVDVGAGSAHVLDAINGAAYPRTMDLTYTFISGVNLERSTEYDVDIRIKQQTGTPLWVEFYFEMGYPNPFGGDLYEKGPIHTFLITAAYAQYLFKLTTPDTVPANERLKFRILDAIASDVVRFDRLSIIKANAEVFRYSGTTLLSNEISAELGYNPTKNVVNSWDDAVVTQGRTWMIGVWIDKRYDDKIFRSAISGAGGSVYDTMNALNYYDVENFDGNDLIGLEILRNMDFVGLKTNGVQRIDALTGRSSDPELGVGCVNRRAIINLGKAVVYPGKNDIHKTDGVNAANLSESTIRNIYRALTDNQKAAMHAGRDERDNAYRLFTGDTSNKTEYVLTKKGWVTAKRGAYPISYSTSRNGDLIFMASTGIVYFDKDLDNDNGTTIFPIWKSTWIDAELLGESISFDEVMIIESMFVFFSGITVTLGIYLDYDESTAFDTIAEIVGGSYIKAGRSLKKPATCRSFQLKITSIDGIQDPGDDILIHSVGFSLSKAGRKIFTNG